MVEERVSDEVVFFAVIASYKDDRERPDSSIVISGLETVRFLVNERELLVIPAPDVLEKPAQLLLREVGEHGANANLAWVALVAKVGAVGEVMLIDDRTTVEALRSQDQLECLAYRGLSDVVSADEQGVLLEDYAYFVNILLQMSIIDLLKHWLCP